MSEHDERPPDDADVDDLDEAERALAARLSVALADRAGTVVVADEAFDPTRRSTLDLADRASATERPATAPPWRGASLDATDDAGTEVDPAALEPFPITPDGAAGRGWIVWIAGAAAAAVLVAAIVMIDAVRAPSIEVGDEPALLVDPDGAWAPTWVPDGLELWGLEASQVGPDDVDSPQSDARVTQLVESTDRSTRVLVSIGGTADILGGDETTTPVTIRGVAGRSRAVTGFIEGAQIGWEESGTVFNATVVEAEPGAATALLDRLELTDPADPEAGYSAPADGSVTVRSEDHRGLRVKAPVSARFTYATDRPSSQDAELTVIARGPSSGLDPAAIGLQGYLMTGFLGEIRPDGSAFSFTPGSDGYPTNAQTVWPDGRMVYSSGPDLDPETAERIAAAVEPVPTAELERRMAEVSDRLGSGPVLARADLPAATVEVIGGSEPSVLCLTVDGRRRCALGDRLSGARGQRPEPEQVAFGSVLVDGRWYLFGANEGPVEISVELGGGGSGTTTGTGPPDPSVRPETAAVDTWTVALLVVPDGWDRATIEFPDRSMNLPRPVS